MDLSLFISQRYPGLRSNLKKSVFDSLSEEEIRKSPAGMNSIAWNIWHMTRAEDVGMNRFIRDGEQVFDQGDWGTKMNLPERHFGTGMSQEEVTDLSNRINIPALQKYQHAVGEQSTQLFSDLTTMGLDQVIDPDYLHKILIDEGVLHQNALWVEDVYLGKKKMWFLVHLILTHNFEHLGQIMLLRKLLGHKGTR